jgi:hypothetical protein
VPAVLTDTRNVTIGIVGFSAVVEKYPLGPKLMEELTAAFANNDGYSVENFTWSPVHVVQRYQGGEMPIPDRIVLVGLASKSCTPGKVAAYRWLGGDQSPLHLQDRIYEAVTGIVDLENTLMIGSHFGVWPSECFSVEIDLQPDTFGTIVMAENEGLDNEDFLTEKLGFSPEIARAELVSTIVKTAKADLDEIDAMDKDASSLVPVKPFTSNHPISTR